MVDFNSVKQQVNSMIGMKFGSFNASVKNMEKVYNQGSGTTSEWSRENNGSYRKSYLNSNHETTAEAFLVKTETQVDYIIFDKNTRRAYMTGWQDKNNASDKFTRIDFWHNHEHYSIVDTNGNGVVDKNDKVTMADKGPSIILGDLLG